MPEESQLKTKVAKGLMWGGLNNATQQILNLVIGIFLARILTPADYGMVGVLAIFSAIAGALQDGGFISALINRKNASHLDFVSVFWFNISCGFTFYIILFFSAPLISWFYDIPELTTLSRLIFLGFLFSSFAISPRAYLYKNLKIKEIAYTSIISLVISGCIGVTLALSGYAYWGLAWQTVTYTFSTTVFSYYFSGFRPALIFSIKPIKEMFGYSSKIVITSIFQALNNNVFSVLLGKFYSAADVGDFNQANKWNTMGHSLITGMISSVAQPSLAKVVDDPQRQCKVFRKLLRFTAFVSFPLMLGLAFIAKDFIVIAITEKWLVSASILQVLCIYGAVFPISYLFSNLILSQGRSTSYMWSTISLALLQILAMCISYPYGLMTMLYIFTAINILWLFCWWRLAKKRISISLLNLLHDTLPFLFVTLAAIIPAYFITGSIENIYICIIAKIIITAILYIGLLWILKAQVLKECIDFIRNKKIN